MFGSPGLFPVSMVRCLVSILTRGESSSSSGRQQATRVGAGGKDELWRAALAILCEVRIIKISNTCQAQGPTLGPTQG